MKLEIVSKTPEEIAAQILSHGGQVTIPILEHEKDREIKFASRRELRDAIITAIYEYWAEHRD